ncbi:MAG: hypothetical protein CL759_06820 [Chloroflexi bacterium]|nr:hypothetical protein [Chloroflexota bacterium]
MGEVIDMQAKIIEAFRQKAWGEVARHATSLDRATNSQGFQVVGAEALFAELPPVPWVVQELELAPGAVSMVAGYGFSGKTIAMQSLALSVASGSRVWGRFDVGEAGRVVHLDYEQGSRLTSERYQRLARAMRLGPDNLAERLDVAFMPEMYLDTPSAEDSLTSLCEGAKLCIVDSFRASAPSAEENDSGAVRLVLDKCTRVSERTGCTFVMIHHARKPSDSASGKFAIRGSSAVFDACQSVLVFGGEKGRPITVEHHKARISGNLCDDFVLEVSDVNERWGLRIVASDAHNAELQRREEEDSALREAVLGYIRQNARCSTREVGGSVSGRTNAIGAMLDRLERQGHITNRATRGRSQWVVS